MKPILKKPGKLKLKGREEPKSKIEDIDEPIKYFPDELKTKDKFIPEKQFIGTGTIVASDRSLHGTDTKFTQQIENGDWIIIQHPISKNIEQREVTLVLGNNSALINQPFSQQITVFQNFTLRKKSKIVKGEDLNEEYQAKLKQIHKSKQISKPTINVRVKKGTWSYMNKQVEVEESVSKQRLLDIRKKLTRDKFCW